MNILSAALLIARAPYAFRRTHEWRGYQVMREGLWPKITIGWWTWDALPEMYGQRVAETVDTVRAMGVKDDDQGSLL
jgi:uncharacterized protein (DUF2235 family)